jgi:transposase
VNPKIGYDWMLRGEQKEVLTPGQNVKRYVAGALEVGTGRLVWVFGERKASGLFVSLLETLGQVYREAKVIHVILDNARLHTSQYTQRRIEGMGGRIVLHFLPPYCPNDNPIERVWHDLHENVTRNHQRQTIQDLIADADAYLSERSAESAHSHHAPMTNHYRQVA